MFFVPEHQGMKKVIYCGQSFRHDETDVLFWVMARRNIVEDTTFRDFISIPFSDLFHPAWEWARKDIPKHHILPTILRRGITQKGYIARLSITYHRRHETELLRDSRYRHERKWKTSHIFHFYSGNRSPQGQTISKQLSTFCLSSAQSPKSTEFMYGITSCLTLNVAKIQESVFHCLLKYAKLRLIASYLNNLV